MPLLDDPEGALADTQENVAGDGGIIDDMRDPEGDTFMIGTLTGDGDTVTGNVTGDSGVVDDAFNSEDDERVDNVVADVHSDGGITGDVQDPDGDPFALERATTDGDTVTGNLVADSGVTDDLLGVTASDLLSLGDSGADLIG